MSRRSLNSRIRRLRRDAERAARVGARRHADALLKEALAAEKILLGEVTEHAGDEASRVLDEQRKSWSAEVDKKLKWIAVGTGFTLLGLYIVTRR